MTLVFDERAAREAANEAGLHAFIVGISAYPHLPGGGGPPALNDYGMRQLTATTRTAFQMYRWLIDNKDHLPVPLATVRLLLSPSPSEVADVAVLDPATNNPLPVDRATRANFDGEAQQWRRDAATRKDNRTFFYFAGHGVQSTNRDSVLLMEDFGDGAGGTLNKAVRTGNLWDGMAPYGPALAQMARTQFFFIDACQSVPTDFLTRVRMSVADVFDVDLTGVDDRQAPVFYAAVPGSLAYSVPGQQTLFGQALLDCLKGQAGDIAQEANTTDRWRVTLGSLVRALKPQFNAVLARVPGGATAGQKYVVDSWSDPDIPLIYLTGTPELDFTIELVPTDAANVAQLQIVDEANNPVVPPLPSPFAPNPYSLRLKAGLYKVTATVTPPYIAPVNPPLLPYRPPMGSRKVRVIP